MTKGGLAPEPLEQAAERTTADETRGAKRAQGRMDMGKLSRRSVLRGSLSLAAAGTIARPFIANAAATTATVWWTQGFVAEEDASFRQLVANYERLSGNKID